jgi:hypothetical protein
MTKEEALITDINGDFARIKKYSFKAVASKNQNRHYYNEARNN